MTERRNILETDPGVKAAVIHPVVAVVFAEMKRRTKRPAVADHADGSTDQKRIDGKKRRETGIFSVSKDPILALFKEN